MHDRPTVACSGQSTVRAHYLSGAARRQRGWAGLVLLLVALVIAGWLARVALRQLTPADPAARMPAATSDVTSAPTAVQRAKGVETQMLEQAEQTRQRIDATEK